MPGIRRSEFAYRPERLCATVFPSLRRSRSTGSLLEDKVHQQPRSQRHEPAQTAYAPTSPGDSPREEGDAASRSGQQGWPSSEMVEELHDRPARIPDACGPAASRE